MGATMLELMPSDISKAKNVLGWDPKVGLEDFKGVVG
jgi:hypothetical protein